MEPLVASIVFLISVYWPFMAGAAVIGLVTGWLSLARKPGEGAS